MRRFFILLHLRIGCGSAFWLVIPVVLEDISRQMKDWGREGAVNPFREVHDVRLF